MTLSGGQEADQGSQGVQIDDMDAVTTGAGQRAVLSLHKRFAYVDSCKFGLTLTNNLPYKITNISFRFAVHAQEGAYNQHVTRNFFEIDPGDRQYREITFPQIRCDQIRFVQITDPGRCAMGDLARFTSRPGECIRHVDVASTPYVQLVQK